MPAFSTLQLDVAKNHINFTVEVRIDGTTCLLPAVFYHLPNLIQHSPFINFGEFCQSSLLFQTPHLLILVDSRHGQREAQAKPPQNCLMYMFFYKHDVCKHIQRYKHIQQKKQESTTTSRGLEILVNVPSTSFVALAGHSMDDELEENTSFWMKQDAYSIVVKQAHCLFHIAQNCFPITMKHDAA